MARKRYPRMDFDQPKRGSGMLPWLLIALLGLLGYLGYRTYQSAPAVPAPAAEAPKTVRDLPLPGQAGPGQQATGAAPEPGTLETAASKLVPPQAAPQAAPGLPALEELTPVDKQLIRMGPDNAAILQDKVRRLRAALQQPPEPAQSTGRREPAAKPTTGGIPLPLPPAMPLPNP